MAHHTFLLPVWAAVAAFAAAAANHPPHADAGPDRGLILPFYSSAPLTGAAKDDDGTITDWSWTQVAGPPVALAGASAGKASVSGVVTPGRYTFRLTVTDDDGASGTDEVDLYALPGGGPEGGAVSGTLRPWHRVTVDFAGPATAEQAAPNPFRDLRLDVTFVHVESRVAYHVPGFFAADGVAAESGATAGTTWRARFTPDRPGAWVYQASFRSGPDVAANLSYGVGAPTSFDGTRGLFVVGGVDPDAPGFRAEGRLEYVGEHHLRFAQSGRPFLKGGADSPENLLAYADFDQTPPTHGYAPHLGDWNPGDPVWKGNRGKELVGALNYLAGKGMNSVYFLTFNVAGDGDDVWPWTSKDERFRFDVGKLAQWEIVFEHMDDLGLMLHVVTQETENDDGIPGLDGGALGVQRKLYYRELVARFGHHLAVTWNLGEENSNSAEQLVQFYDALTGLDAYDHPVTLHSFPWQADAKYEPMLAAGILEGPSQQVGSVSETRGRTLQWVEASADAGRPWVVTLDENGPASVGVAPDAVDFWHDNVRINGLWGNLTAGGAGAEWYFGYQYANDDLDCEDWRSRDHMWDLTRYALEFFDAYVPFDAMATDDALVGAGNWCLADPGACYLVYLPNGGVTSLDLTGAAGTFSVLWFDPRNGGPLATGSVDSIVGGGWTPLGSPPQAPDEDWAVLVQLVEGEPAPSAPSIEQFAVSAVALGATTSLDAWIDVVDADDDVVGVTLYLFAPGVGLLGKLPAQLQPDGLWTVEFLAKVAAPPGEFVAVAVAEDAAGLSDSAQTAFSVE